MITETMIYRRSTRERASTGSVREHMRVLLVVCACLLSAGTALAQNVAGIVKKSQGNVLIQREGKSIPAPVGTRVLAGDVLRTSDASSTGVMLKDETRISLGPNSQVTLDKYGFNANTNSGSMFLSVFKGTLMMITGLIVKSSPSAVVVKTPTSTAGVRGTQFIVEVP